MHRCGVVLLMLLVVAQSFADFPATWTFNIADMAQAAPTDWFIVE